MNKRTPLVRLFAAFTFTFALTAAHLGAQVTTFNDATNDIAPGIATAGGTLDIVKMETVDDETDVIFTMTVNGNFTAPNSDWGNFMIGIANGKTPGSTTGNGWNRPINLNAGGGNGMTHWIGSWNGGSQLWTYQVGGGSGTGSNWSGPAALVNYLRSAGAQSTVVFSVSKESLGVTNGDTIIFDAYSSGGGGTDSAIDALANTNVTVTNWSGAYTSVAPTLTKSYTLANTASPITNTVTFSVDMSAQISVGAFDPLFDIVSVAGSFNGFNPAANSLSEIGGGIYQATIPVVAGSGTIVGYRYVIDSGLFEAENLTRTFPVGTDPDPAPLIIPTVFFDNIEGYRDVTFTVDMSEQQTLGTFNPATQTVEVRGAFNNWAGTALTDQGSGIYSGTLTIGGAPDQLEQYKFYVAGTDALGYEAGDNRTFNLALNPDGSPTPALVLSTVSFRAAQLRPVTFSVDMSIQQALGLFDPATGTVQLRSGSFGEGDARALTREGATAVFSGTFSILGEAETTFQYKFWSPGLNFYNVPNNTGFEQINLNDSFVNRTLTLDANGVAMDLPVAFFSNQLFYTVGAAPNPFSTTQGTASAAQNVTINGQGLTANIVATAPTGFEVSADGITYGSTANLIPVLGAVTGTNNLFVRLAASAAAGSPSGNVSLTSTDSQPVNIAVSGTVTASGETFINWSGGESLTPALQLQYAIGGATSPTATNGVPSVTTVTSNTLSITAVVRTNDPTLTVNGQSLIDLAVGPWTTNNVTMTPQLDTAPEGCQVQTFSTPRGEDSKKFLRLQTTLPAEPQR